jgi:hypothetical protein
MGLSTAERTGSPVLHTLWSYVLGMAGWLSPLRTYPLDGKEYDFVSKTSDRTLPIPKDSKDSSQVEMGYTSLTMKDRDGLLHVQHK